MAEKKIKVGGILVRLSKTNDKDYVSLTDIASKDGGIASDIIKNWLRARNTIEYLGLWESLENDNFNSVEFDRIRNQSGAIQPKNGDCITPINLPTAIKEIMLVFWT